MLRVLFSLYVWVMIMGITFIFSPIFVLTWILTALFDKKLTILHHLGNFWGSLFTILNPLWKVEISGKEKLNNKSKIIVANHQSQEDILLMYRLGVAFRWISKAEVFRIPFYGWMMQLNGDIKLKRTSKSSIRKMIIDAKKVLAKGCTIAIFPEGTRSKNGQLGNFKEGAFKLAIETQTPILPIIIQGTGQQLVYPNGLFKGKHKATIKILDEIPYSEFKDMEIKELTRNIRGLINNELCNTSQ